MNKVTLYLIQWYQCDVDMHLIALFIFATHWLQDGAGAVHLVSLSGKIEMIQMLVEEFGLSVDVKDKVCVIATDVCI